MSKAVLLDALVDARRKTILHEEDGKHYIESRQDAEPVLEFVSQHRDRPQDPEFRWLGEVLEVDFNRAVIEGWVHDDKAWRKYLADRPRLRSDAKF